jgi:hypothetical protein
MTSKSHAIRLGTLVELATGERQVTIVFPSESNGLPCWGRHTFMISADCQRITETVKW